MATTGRASVIKNSSNCRRFLKQAIDRALYQRYADTEVIVVDNGSAIGPSRSLSEMSSIGEILQMTRQRFENWNGRASPGRVLRSSRGRLLVLRVLHGIGPLPPFALPVPAGEREAGSA